MSEFDTVSDPPKQMIAERAQGSFPSRDLTYFIYGGKEATKAREELLLELERDPILNQENYYDVSKDEIRERTMKRIAKIARYIEKDTSVKAIAARISALILVDMSLATRIGVHYGLFCSSIAGSGTKKQVDYWLFKRGAYALKGIAGCFAMTELAHGSNVAALQTTATFDPNNDEFIINTPHIGATKWWIGGAAHTATHTVCFARLISKGKDYGVKNFVVPLRNPETYELLPGIALGDLGKKMGRDGIDNGWIQFTNVRIPRSYFLQNHTKIDENGNVTQPPLAQLAYGALINGRVNMGIDSASVGMRMITIAIRYGVVRRQFSSETGKPETKLLDYPLHRRRLIPLLAEVYAIQFAALEVQKLYNSLIELQSKINLSNKQEVNEMVKTLKSVFTSTAGLKAFATWATADTIDQCRQACGGHGYSGYNGFGTVADDWHVMLTWEGDNSVLSLSVGRSLIQSYLLYKKSGAKAVSSDGIEYIGNIDNLSGAKLGNRQVTNPDVVLEAWSAVAASVVKNAGEAFLKELSVNSSNDTAAFESVSQFRFLAAKIHTTRYITHKFYKRIESAPENLKPVLTKLFLLYGLWKIEADSGLFLESGFFETKDLSNVRNSIDLLCSQLRPDLITLTDAFGLSDYYINAPIGSYDGNVYVKYFDKIKRANPPENYLAEYYNTVVKPFIHRKITTDVPELTDY